MREGARTVAVLALGVAFSAGSAGAESSLEATLDSARSVGERARALAIRGLTIGPIENAYHPGVGYGSPAYLRTLKECRAWGATWVALTPFGRVADLRGTGVDPTFEAPFEQNRLDVERAIRMAHAQGLRVMLVPHLWVESGEWRAKIQPESEAQWARWAESYGSFIRKWAAIAESSKADLFSVGVELRFWATSVHALSLTAIIADVRRTYHGSVTYSANWDDVDQTVILGDLDVIGVNAFYPLADHDGATQEALLAGAEQVRAKIDALAVAWRKPVVFTEMGYTTRPDPAVRPWEWPDAMNHVRVDERAQALAYGSLLAPLAAEPNLGGFFVWRIFSDPDDVSQEADWGFSPRGKLAQSIVEGAFATFAREQGAGLPSADLLKSTNHP